MDWPTQTACRKYNGERPALSALSIGRVQGRAFDGQAGDTHTEAQITPIKGSLRAFVRVEEDRLT